MFIGPLDAPYSFGASLCSTSIFVLSWGAPFSLDVTDYSPDIFYYILCTNITIYECKAIYSDPDCIYPNTCTSFVNFTINDKNMDYGEPIEFTFFAVNGAGNGAVAKTTYNTSEMAHISKSGLA